MIVTSLRGFFPTAERRQRILGLSLPIIGAMASQNVVNLVDTAMVGSLGNAALAAVGLGGMASFLAISFLMGMSSAVQALAARRAGEGKHDETAASLNGGLLLSLVLGLPLSVGLWFLAPVLFPLLSPDPEVARIGTSYLQIRLLSACAVGMNFAFRGYWNAVDRPTFYMRTLVTMHVFNIFFNWVFIYGNLGMPALGADGAAIGNTLANFLGTAMYTVQGLAAARGAGFMTRMPSWESLRAMAKQALPASVERLFFSASMIAFYWIIGRIGTQELAAANVLLNLALVAILPGLGFGIAAGTLSAQALGRGEREDAARWGWEVARMASALVALLAIPAVLAPELVLRAFLKDPETVALAVWPLRIMAIQTVIDSTSLVLSNALLGVGAARVVMLVSISFQWLLFLPLAWLVGPTLGYGLAGVWVAQAAHRTLQSGVMAWIWSRRSWASIRV